MMGRIGLAGSLIVLCALGGCQSGNYVQPAPAAPPVQAGTPIALSPAQVEQVQAGVRANLKDPASATFSGAPLAAIGPAGEITACGLVNAKNSYGGYVGDSLYIATVRVGQPADVAVASDRQAEILRQMCRQHGVMF